MLDVMRDGRDEATATRRAAALAVAVQPRWRVTSIGRSAATPASCRSTSSANGALRRVVRDVPAIVRTDPDRSATFEDAEARLPYIASMGFDVLYLPPIHPIGRASARAEQHAGRGAGRPREPVGDRGRRRRAHAPVEPGLGTIDDFDRFVEAAQRLGLEIALDLAYQASPDHPYVKEHPAWFRHRPDGTIKYAENPPKKYQDIYPIDFESERLAGALARAEAVIEFWIGHGVKIFRVDNPHTKPFGSGSGRSPRSRAQHPDTIFLSEAFTRPKVMRYLAKSGFSQSYTYFTWRNTKDELIEYFTELTQTDVREYMRPNLFANTPDILHEYLQHGGRPAFQVRLILAATLGATYGIYSGFELCENVPVKPGSEEYLDSEKYQIRLRDFDDPAQPGGADPRDQRDPPRAPGAAARSGPAVPRDRQPAHHLLQQASRDGRIRPDPGGRQPRSAPHAARLRPLPLGRLGLSRSTPPSKSSTCSRAERYYWRGEWNYVRLDPQARVGAHPPRARCRARPLAGHDNSPQDGPVEPLPVARHSRGVGVAKSLTMTTTPIRSGTRTPSSTRRTCARSSTATTTASATSRA